MLANVEGKNAEELQMQNHRPLEQAEMLTIQKNVRSHSGHKNKLDR
jgi:hypothetical protein